ncbi:hypothetical protein UlMin_002432 [Ulmus minor]
MRTCGIENASKLQDNLDMFNKLIQYLASCSIKFPDEQLAVILLNSLPDCFESLINAIEYGKDTLTKEIVINAIRAHDFKAKMREDQVEKVYSDCKKILRDEKTKSHTENGEASIAKGEQQDGDVLVVCSNVSERQSCKKWILDSRCTYHMCPNRDWFKNFKETNGGKAFLGDNTSCQVRGI